MSRNKLISGDDSNNDASTSSARENSARTKTKTPMLDDILLSSDSDDEDIVVRRVRPKKDTSVKEVMLGEISLLTSDEEDSAEDNPPPKRTKKIENGQQANKMGTVDLLTSDEENVPEYKVPPSTKTKAPAKKRKITEPDKDKDESVSPLKKAKASETKAKPPVVKKTTTRRKPATIKPRTKSTDSKRTVSQKFPDGDLDTSIDGVNPAWKESELLAERTQIDHEIALNLIKLWEEGNTIPFIARYRKNVIGNMTPEELRTTKEGYDEICNLKKKMCTVAKAVFQVGKLDNKLQGNICAARTIEELEHIYAPFKPDSKRTLAERAKRCGLEEPALHLLNNTSMVNPTDYVKPDVKDIKTPEDVEKGIIHIIASEIATDLEMLKFLRELRAKTCFKMHTKKARQTKAKEKISPNKVTTTKNKKELPENKLTPEELKFEIYFEYRQRTDYLKSHQILAINRGESLKILTVKIEIPEIFERKFKSFCTQKWISKSMYDTKRREILDKAVEDAFQRLITPLIGREIRSELKQKAEKESCKVFSDNLKHLLIAQPMKGKSILGIDPGYTNGCKLALISSTGSLLAFNVVYPHNNRNQYKGEGVIKDMLLQNKCDLIAIGNGTACRKTEEWISQLVGNKFFGNLDVKYTIVNEDGASIYSCSPEAKKEFGNLDPNIISAVSLARRIQDPMAELVKVEPSHLGVGMYQLDIKKKQLEEALSEVVSECVSFVGVDLNTASQCLLRRVAGLSDKKATQIIDYRERQGAFTHRRQLLDVYGIGERVFEQCAGFLRVGPMDPYDTEFYKKNGTTPLDATIIHPESYPIVRNLFGKMDLKEKDVGTEKFISNFKRRSAELNVDALGESFKTNKETIRLIFDALSKTLNHDLRAEISKTPLFKKSVQSMDELEVGTVLTGRVKNVTSFGAFVDVGVGRDGLVHVKNMTGLTVHLGDIMEVEVIGVDRVKGHIQLKAISRIIE